MSAMITALTTCPNAAETTLATSRISTSGLAKYRSSSRRASKRGGGASSLGPWVARRAAASAAERPRSVPAAPARACSMPRAQGAGAGT